jgi:hypothetical protein
MVLSFEYVFIFVCCEFTYVDLKMKKIIIVVLDRKKGTQVYESLEDYVRSLTYYRAVKLISQIKSVKHISVIGVGLFDKIKSRLFGSERSESYEEKLKRDLKLKRREK